MELAEAAERYLAGETNNAEVLVTLSQGSDPNGRDFYMLFNCLRDANILFWTPEILKRIIKEEKWHKWQWIGRQFEAATLTDYLTKHPPKGLGAKLEDVEKLIANDEEALTLFREGTTGKKGAHHNNVMMKAEQGNSKKYTLDRLKRKRPEKSALDTLRKAWVRATPEEREIFASEISEP